jgi:phosphomannomutase
VQVLPDADEPLVHLYAEGASTAASEDLETELRNLVTEVIQREEIGATP